MHATDAEPDDRPAVQKALRRLVPLDERRKLHIARHAQGTDAIGWILLGFVAGAATAIFALTHADFPGHKLLPAAAAAATRPATEPAKVAVLEPAKPAPKPAAAAVEATPAPKPDPNARPWAAPSNDAQVAEDAAAAGMTARSAPQDSRSSLPSAKDQDLY